MYEGIPIRKEFTTNFSAIALTEREMYYFIKRYDEKVGLDNAILDEVIRNMNVFCQNRSRRKGLDFDFNYNEFEQLGNAHRRLLVGLERRNLVKVNRHTAKARYSPFYDKFETLSLINPLKGVLI